MFALEGPIVIGLLFNRLMGPLKSLVVIFFSNLGWVLVFDNKSASVLLVGNFDHCVTR